MVFNCLVFLSLLIGFDNSCCRSWLAYPKYPPVLTTNHLKKGCHPKIEQQLSEVSAVCTTRAYRYLFVFFFRCCYQGLVCCGSLPIGWTGVDGRWLDTAARVSLHMLYVLYDMLTCEDDKAPSTDDQSSEERLSYGINMKCQRSRQQHRLFRSFCEKKIILSWSG